MLKITPNSPISSSIESIDPHIVDRALAHYNLPPGASSKRRGANSTRKISAEPESREEILVDASSILESAAATAYEHADNLTGPFAAASSPLMLPPISPRLHSKRFGKGPGKRRNRLIPHRRTHLFHGVIGPQQLTGMAHPQRQQHLPR